MFSEMDKGKKIKISQKVRKENCAGRMQMNQHMCLMENDSLCYQCLIYNTITSKVVVFDIAHFNIEGGGGSVVFFQAFNHEGIPCIL